MGKKTRKMSTLKNYVFSRLIDFEKVHQHNNINSFSKVDFSLGTSPHKHDMKTLDGVSVLEGACN